MTRYSSLSSSAAGGTAPAFSNSALVDQQGGVTAVVEDHVRAVEPSGS
jgi:hypothetical protein